MLVLTVLVLLLFYITALAYLYRGLQARRLEGKPAQSLPSVSVIVAARNEAPNLPRLIRCLMQQDYPGDRYEVCIVDDRSTDNTWPLLQQAARQHPHLRVLRIQDTLPDFAPKKRALHAGIQHTQGEILLFTDADCLPPPTWIRSMISYYRADTAMVIGYSPYWFARPLPRWIRGMLQLDNFALAAVAAASTALGRPLTCTGTNLSYRRSAYEAVGGFERIRTWLSGDDDLMMHLIARHRVGRFAYALHRQAHVPAAGPQSLAQFVHQRIRYASKTRQYHPAMIAGLAAVYGLNLLILAGSVSLLWAASLSGLAALTAWLVKAAAEYLFLRAAANSLGERQLLAYFLPTALVHPLYIAVFAALGFFGRFRWKE